METSKFASRKFIISFLVLISYALLLVYKFIDPYIYQYLTIGTIGLYFTGNVTQDFLKDWVTAKLKT